MKIIDTYSALLTAYEEGAFSLAKWKAYIGVALPGISPLLVSDMEECLHAGYTWEKDFLPVLNAVVREDSLREQAYDSFCAVTKDLEQTICARFGKTLEIDLIFYLGLCNGAGWVTNYCGRKVILFGIEKIMELNWCGLDDMRGLIYHELGHVYQAQYGILDRQFDRDAERFLWQLFTEGIAMCFEQALVRDPDYYHQDKNGWKAWCDDHLDGIKADFDRDLNTMTQASQRYFGDWVWYNGHNDVGYYLGCRFVQDILSGYPFDEAIRFDMDKVTELYRRFIEA